MGKRILLVDDDPELVELVRFNLEAAGFLVRAAADGAEGLKLARALRPDLILLDLMMPELDGFSVCEILRRDRATASIPIFIVTAVATQLSRCAGFEAGADAYITKPFSLKSLMSRIQQILNGSRDPSEFEDSGGAGEAAQRAPSSGKAAVDTEL